MQCEIQIMRSMYEPDRLFRCSNDRIGWCIECSADVCKEHGAPCELCGVVVCDDFACSNAHRLTHQTFVEKVYEFLENRERGNA